MANNCLLDGKSAYFLTDEYTRYYFSGVSVAEGYMLKTANSTYYFADARYFYALGQKLKNSNVIAKLYKSLDSIKQVITELNITTLYIDYNVTTLTEYAKYKELGVEIKNGADSLIEMRKSKNQTELNAIAKACKIASDAFEYVLPYIKAGVTERSIKNRLEKFMIKQGATSPSFETIVAFGANSAVPHHQTGNTKLKQNQVVLLDYGCVFEGYCSDMTRTVFYGTPTQEFVSAYNLVASANLLGEQKAVKGAKVKDVDKCVRDYFAKSGVDNYFTHSLGHGIGLQIHEDPYLSPRGQGELDNGYVFSIEPGLYFDGKFGIRIENTVTIENGKPKSLTGNGRDLIILGN